MKKPKVSIKERQRRISEGLRLMWAAKKKPKPKRTSDMSRDRYDIDAPKFAVPQKTHAHCKSPGCMEIGVCQPHDEYPHILFCAKHGRRLIIATVKSIVDGTHPDLVDSHQDMIDPPIGNESDAAW